MPITIADVRPFFQILIFKVPDNFDLPSLARRIVRYINSKNEKSYSKFVKKDALLEENDTHVVYYEHAQHPSWYRVDRGGRFLEAGLRNREYDLLILHVIGEYLFAHASCISLSDRVNDAIKQHTVNRISVKPISPSRIKRVLNNLNLKLSTVALDNVYGVGGTAPESKAYYSPDAGNCLTASSDSGYAMNYFFGRDQDDGSKPVGASSAKRKVWKSWVEDVDTFKVECDTLVNLIELAPAVAKLPVLVDEIDPFPFTNDDIVVFNLGCVSDQKLIHLKLADQSFGEWAADLNPANNNLVTFTLLAPMADPIVIDYEFAYDEGEVKWTFAPNGDDELMLVFATEAGNEFSNPITLSSYLNKGAGFTFIFTEGRAFSNGAFTRNNRFLIPFGNADCTMVADWGDVLITRESKEDGLPAGKITILEKIKRVVQDQNPNYLILDDGANEVADHVIAFDNRLILSHAKRSKELTPSLRVDDLQVVCSQAVKNLRYFTFESYSDDTIARLFEKLKIDEDQFDVFRDSFAQTFRNLNLKKECWIVQPGISLQALTDDPGNKIHTLLNYVEGICLNNNVTFRLICSP